MHAAPASFLALLGLTLVARSTAIGGFCNLILPVLPKSACTCKEKILGFDAMCLVPAGPLGRLGIELTVAPCGFPAELVTKVVKVDKQNKTTFSYTLEKVTSGQTKVLPIPGLGVNLGVADAGLDADISVKGNADSLYIGLSLGACIEVLSKKLCASSLSSDFPIKIINTTLDFGHACATAAPTQSPTVKAVKPASHTGLVVFFLILVLGIGGAVGAMFHLKKGPFADKGDGLYTADDGDQ